MLAWKFYFDEMVCLHLLQEQTPDDDDDDDGIVVCENEMICVSKQLKAFI